MISFEIPEELELFAKTARDFAEKRLRPAAREAERSGIPAALIEEYLALGLHAVEIPEAFGGLGQGLVGRALVESVLAGGDLGIALGLPAIGPGAEAVRALGSEAQKAELLGAWCVAGTKSAIAWSEEKPKPGTFSTVAKRRAGGGYTLNGKKSEVVLGDEAGAMVVFARAIEEDGTSSFAAFVVPRDAEGLRVDGRLDGLGLSAAPPVSLTMEDLAVPESARLSGSDDRFSEQVAWMFLRIAIVGAAREVGLARAAFAYARDYAEERTAFGKPIAHFQGLAFLLADMATRVEVMDGLVKRAAWALDRSDGNAEAARLAAGAVAECHEGVMWVTNNAVQVLGGAGFVDDHPVEKWMRDAKTHMAFAMPHQLCDLLLGRMALEGGPLAMEQDAPMPGVQPVLI